MQALHPRSEASTTVTGEHGLPEFILVLTRLSVLQPDRTEGVLGLYRGFNASVVTFVPSSAIWCGCSWRHLSAHPRCCAF